MSSNNPWSLRRLRFLEDYGSKCKACGSTENIHVHHLSYEFPRGSEPDTDLVVLCQTCHEKVHRLERTAVVELRVATELIIRTTPAMNIPSSKVHVNQIIHRYKLKHRTEPGHQVPKKVAERTQELIKSTSQTTLSPVISSGKNVLPKHRKRRKSKSSRIHGSP